MEPTINPGDGFIAVPTAITGEVQQNDVVVFRAQEIQAGGLTTHRIAGETERGYITRGDANPFTDQDSGEPPVKDPQIVAKLVQFGGSVIIIPQLGTAVTGIQGLISTVQQQLASILGTRSLLGTQGLTYILLASSILLYLYDIVAGSGRDDKLRERARERDQQLSTEVIIIGFAVLIMVAATAAMVVPAGTQEYSVISADFDSGRPTVIEKGTTGSLEYKLPNSGMVPVVAYIEPGSEAVGVQPKQIYVSGQSTEATTVRLSAPSETGVYYRFITEYRYLALLPTPVIDAAYQLHPWIPIIMLDLLVGIPFYIFGRALSDDGRPRSRSRDGISTFQRILNRYS
jgi:Peptidase S24-like.